ncbi:MAG: ferredoxin family protein [Vulcanimicrobiota bacterium]
MTHVITDACLGVKDGICVEYCPVDCIHSEPDEPSYYIDPDECIDCGACVPVCPVAAIFPHDELPEDQLAWLGRNAAFFQNDSK